MSREGYLYVIHSTSGHYKIGISKNPERRLRQLIRTQGPFIYTLVNTIWTNDMRAAEADMHKWLDDYRARGEWFDVSPEKLGPLLTAEEYTI